MQISSNMPNLNLASGNSNLKKSDNKGETSSNLNSNLSAETLKQGAGEASEVGKAQIIASLNLEKSEEAGAASAGEDEDPMKKLEKLLKQLQKELQAIQAQKERLGNDENAQKIKEMLANEEASIMAQISDVIAQMQKILEAQMQAQG